MPMGRTYHIIFLALHHKHQFGSRKVNLAGDPLHIQLPGREYGDVEIALMQDLLDLDVALAGLT